MKLALGTVQFGIDYGINNSAGIPGNDVIQAIFQYAYEEGISLLDTAPKYGSAEKKIGELGGSRFDIVTKFYAAAVNGDIEFQLKNSLSAVGMNSIYGYLSHNADELIKDPSIWEDLINEKNKGKIKKIGYSLYTTNQLETLVRLDLIPDIVQLPYSLLDRKFEPYFDYLKDKGVEIHTRSAFLQGLYFMNPNSLPVKLAPLSSNLKSLQLICSKNKVSMSYLAMQFVIMNKAVDKVVVGVESLSQLKDNVVQWKMLTDITLVTVGEILSIEVKNKDLLNPVNWQ